VKQLQILVRVFAIFSLVTGVAVLCDLCLASTEHDSATITEKTPATGRRSRTYIYARGHFHYCENVPPRFWSLCEVGDTLKISLTPVFKEWRHVALVRNGAVIAAASGRDIFYMALFGVIFLAVAAVSMVEPGILLRKPLCLISALVVDLVAALLCAKYVAVLAGAVEKM
jgi:hypothetical protein